MPTEHAERIAVTEARVMALSEEVRELSRDVRGLASAVADLSRSVAVLAERVATMRSAASPVMLTGTATAGGGLGAAIMALLKSLGIV